MPDLFDIAAGLIILPIVWLLIRKLSDREGDNDHDWYDKINDL